MDGLTEIIDARLDGDCAVHRKQHHTAKREFDRLREEHGFTGGYLPRANVEAASAASYMALMSEAAE